VPHRSSLKLLSSRRDNRVYNNRRDSAVESYGSFSYSSILCIVQRDMRMWYFFEKNRRNYCRFCTQRVVSVSCTQDADVDSAI